MAYIDLHTENLKREHICCAFSDKKCAEGYAMKKDWLAGQFEKGYVFRRLDERAKVFIEFGPAEMAWMPVNAPDYLMLGCFWVSGSFKSKGHGKALLESVISNARNQGKLGLAAVVGSKKYHFMSDTRWLLAQGFRERDTTKAGFSLLTLDVDGKSGEACFTAPVKTGTCPESTGLTVYYSNRCPFCEYYVREVLTKTAAQRDLPLTIHKIESLEEARSAPTPATIFSLFRDGKFVTTDLGVCLANRFGKIITS